MRSYGLEVELVRVVVYLVQGIGVRLPPAVCATKVAGVNVRCHLHTAMALYAVECTLVAGPVGDQGLLGPVANLDPAVLTDKVVPLLREPAGNARLDLRHRALDHFPRIA